MLGGFEVFVILVVLSFVLFTYILPRMRQPPRHAPIPAGRYNGPEVRELERQARNNRPYQIAAIPPDADRLTLFRHYSEFRGEGLARVQLYPGLRSRDECTGRHAPAPFHPHVGAIWSWEGDNRDRDNAGLQAEAVNRFNQMLAVLEQNGWRSNSHDPEVTLYQFYRE